MSKRKNKGYTAVKGNEEIMSALKTEGMTYEEIAKILGLRDGEVVRNCLRRQKQRSIRLVEGQAARPKGRPRKDGTLQTQDPNAELKRLRMENELLRDFLHTAGRK